MQVGGIPPSSAGGPAYPVGETPPVKPGPPPLNPTPEEADAYVGQCIAWCQSMAKADPANATKWMQKITDITVHSQRPDGGARTPEQLQSCWDIINR